MLFRSSPTTISENGGSATATVTRNNTDIGQELVVNVASNDTTEASVPATVTIPANQASTTFTVSAVDDTLLDGWHVNFIGELPEAWEDYVVEPKRPRRVFA